MIVLVYKRTYITTQHWRNPGSLLLSHPSTHLVVGGGGEKTAKGKLESSLTADVMQNGLGSLVVAQKAKQNYHTT